VNINDNSLFAFFTSINDHKEITKDHETFSADCGRWRTCLSGQYLELFPVKHKGIISDE
jgi:hypothetical protein